MKAKIYDTKGKEAGSVDLPAELFDRPLNMDLIHQVYVSMTSNERENIAHTKDRGEVRGGGRKPWQQKGTGRARHGSRRSPIWKGGGVTFGPRNDRNYDKKINKKMKTSALLSALSQKMRDGEIIFVDGLSMDEPKTKIARDAIAAIAKASGTDELATKRKNAALVTTIGVDQNVVKSFANIAAIETGEFRQLNLIDLLTNKYLVVTSPKESIEMLAAKISSDASDAKNKS